MRLNHQREAIHPRAQGGQQNRLSSTHFVSSCDERWKSIE
jgi:hypothetical protein